MAKKLRDEDLVLNIIINGNKSKKEMQELDRAIVDTNKELVQLKKLQKDLINQGKQETEAYKATEQAIRDKNAAITMAEARLGQLRSGMKMTEMSITDLEKELRKLTQLWKTSAPGSENQQKYKAEADAIRGRIAELKGGAEETGGILEQISGKIEKYLGAAGVAFVAFLAAALPVITKIGEAYYALNDKLADVSKTTGLTGDSLYELNDDLKDIDTRTAQEGLLDLAVVAGKLGISGKQDVLEFVRAADQIGVALGEDLGDVDQAVNDLGKLTDLFKLKDQFGLENALLKTGSAINALGAAGTANEGYIVEFAKRLGTIAPSANISIENVLGLAATMDELGQNVEASSTAIGQFVVGMGSNIPKFAKVAGMSVKEFGALLKKDANEALIAVLKNIKSTGGGVEELAANMGLVGEDGARAVAALGALSGGLDILTKRQAMSNSEFAKGTSLTNEFASKNENFSASLDKIGKWFNGWATNGSFAKFLDDISVKFVDMIGLGKSASDRATQAFENQTVAVRSLEGNINPLLARYDELKSKTNLSKIEQDELKKVINDISLIVPTAATSFDTYGRALDISKSKVQQFMASQKALLKYQNHEALTETATELDAIKKRIQDTVKFLNRGKITETVSGSTLGVGGYENTRALTAKEITQYRNQLIADQKKLTDLRNRYKGLDGSGFDTSGQNSKTTGTVDENYNHKESDAEAKKRLAEERKAATESEKIRKAELSAENIAYQERLKSVGLFGKNRKDLTSAELEDLAKLEQEHLDKIQTINDKNGKISLSKSSSALEEFKRRTEAEKAYRLELVNSQSSEILQENIAHLARLKKAGIDEKKVTEEQKAAFEVLEKMHQDKLDVIDTKATTEHLNKLQKRHDKELNALKEKNSTELSQITTLEQAKELLVTALSTRELAKIKTLAQAKKALKEKYAQEEARFTATQLQDLAAILQKAIDTGEVDGLNLSDKILSEDQLEQLSQRLGAAKAKIAELMTAGNEKGSTDETGTKEFSFGGGGGKTDVLGMSIEDWDLFFSHIDAGKFGLSEMVAIVGALTSAYQLYSNFMIASEKKQLQAYEKATDEKKAKLQKQLDSGVINQETYNKKVAVLDADLDKKKAEIELKQAKRERTMALLNIASSTAQAIIGIWAQVPKFDFGISAGILSGIVAGIGLAQAADVLAAPLPGKEEGGFLEATRAQDGKRFSAKYSPVERGFIPKTSVIVSENGTEFVANASAVRNPNVKPVLDIIDTAQRNGTIDTLNIEQMFYPSNSTKKIPGREKGGYYGNDQHYSSYGQPQYMDPEMLITISDLKEINAKLIEVLSNPIKADVSLLGKNGFNAAQQELEKLQKDSAL